VARTDVAIRAAGLAKRYGARHALNGVDLEVESGTVLGLLGPNGAGKTTLLRVLTTVVRPDAGSFTIAGASSDDPIAVRRRVGLLPESTGLPTGETGREVLVVQGRLFGRTEHDARTKADQLLDIVGLRDRGGSLVSGYSRGMRQRLGIARALVNDPAVLFLDEPTLGLDPAGQRQVLDHVVRVAHDSDATVVLSTHLLSEVEDTCDRVVVLNRGSIVADGGVRDVAATAAAPRRGRVTVDAEKVVAAVAALRALPVVDAVDETTPHGSLAVLLHAGVSAADGASNVVGALVEARVPLLGFDLERGRLSDAFLELTGQP
jgi:ABC-2 type transport system ATP-binding protein